MIFWIIRVSQQYVHEKSNPSTSPLLTARFNATMRFLDEQSARAMAELVAARIEADKTLRCVRVVRVQVDESEPIVTTPAARQYVAARSVKR